MADMALPAHCHYWMVFCCMSVLQLVIGSQVGPTFRLCLTCGLCKQCPHVHSCGVSLCTCGNFSSVYTEQWNGWVEGVFIGIDSIMCPLARVRTAAAEHRRFAFTACCFSVAGTLILNLILPEAAVVSAHVTEMAMTLVLESLGWEETFPWPISTGSQGLAPVTMAVLV